MARRQTPLRMHVAGLAGRASTPRRRGAGPAIGQLSHGFGHRRARAVEQAERDRPAAHRRPVDHAGTGQLPASGRRRDPGPGNERGIAERRVEAHLMRPVAQMRRRLGDQPHAALDAGEMPVVRFSRQLDVPRTARWLLPRPHQRGDVEVAGSLLSVEKPTSIPLTMKSFGDKHVGASPAHSQ